MDSFSLNFKGDKQIAAALGGLPESLRERFVPIALRYAGAAIVRRARQLAPVDMLADPAGLLKKSIGLLMRGRRGKPKYVAFGARRGFAQTVARPIVIGGEIRGGATRKQDPANIAHLIEFGHFVVVPKKGTSIRKGNAILASSKSFVAARPFLRPAMIGAKAEVKARLIESLREQLQRYFAKVAKVNPFARAA